MCTIYLTVSSLFSFCYTSCTYYTYVNLTVSTNHGNEHTQKEQTLLCNEISFDRFFLLVKWNEALIELRERLRQKQVYLFLQCNCFIFGGRAWSRPASIGRTIDIGDSWSISWITRLNFKYPSRHCWWFFASSNRAPRNREKKKRR